MLFPPSATPSFPSPIEAPSVNWYALYTCSRHEKQVAAQLQLRAIESFLPLYASVRRWKDRRVSLQLPLFPGYIFVHTSLQHRIDVLDIPGAVRFVSCNGRPSAVPEDDVDRLRSALTEGLCMQPHPYLRIGRRVRVRSGPLTGMQGVLVRKRDHFRLVLSIDIIMRSVAVEVDASDVDSLP